MTRAETYGDLARLEQLLDEHASLAALDPGKLPAVRAQIWTLIQAARLDHDLGLSSRPHDVEFDDFLLHVDGWLCEVKDAQIRDGLHVGEAPPATSGSGWSWPCSRPPLGRQRGRCRAAGALGLAEEARPPGRGGPGEAQARALVEAMELAGWRAGPNAAWSPTSRRRPRTVERLPPRGRGWSRGWSRPPRARAVRTPWTAATCGGRAGRR